MKTSINSFKKKRGLALIALIFVSALLVSITVFALDSGTVFEANLKGEKNGVIGEKYVVNLTFENFAQKEFLGATAKLDYDTNVFEIDNTYLGIVKGEITSGNYNAETYPLINGEDGWVFWCNSAVSGTQGCFSVNVLNDSSEITPLVGSSISCFVEFKVKDNAPVSQSIIKVDTDSELVGVFSKTLIETKKGTGSSLSVNIVESSASDFKELILKDDCKYSMGYNEFASMDILYGFKEKSTVSEIISSFKNSAENLRIVSGNSVLNSTDKVPTSAVVQLLSNGTVIDSVTLVCKGDVDGTGTVDSTDYLTIKKYFLESFDMNKAFLSAADIDCNNVIDGTDYMRVKSYFLGNIDIYSWLLYCFSF